MDTNFFAFMTLLSLFSLTCCLKLESMVQPVSRTFDAYVRKCEVSYDIRVLPGTRWTEGCRKCRCDPDAGKVCEGPVCPIPYHPSHTHHCVQWSADRCCCERVGCISQGVIYDFGRVFPKTPDSCEECLCEDGPGPEKCWRKHCQLRCVDGKHVAGKCCKQCVNGDNCSIPPLEGVDLNNNVATKTPISLNDTRTIRGNTKRNLFYLCVCVIPGASAMCFQNMFL